MPPNSLLWLSPPKIVAQVVDILVASPIGTSSITSVQEQFTQYLPFVHASTIYNRPIAPWPADQSQDQSPNTFLAWQLQDTDGAPLRYEIYLDANLSAPQTLIFQGRLDQTAFVPPNLLIDTAYVWQVFSLTDDGRRTPGPVWAFHTEGIPIRPDVEAMITIPAGEFRMGCEPSENPPAGCIPKHQDTPQHTVYLDAYEIDKYEVTNAQYRACVDAGVCSRPRRYDSRHRKEYFYTHDFDDYPVLFVSWWNAQDYCAWKDKRLPTEAEWEKAARGPFDTRPWPWGWEFPTCDRANFTDNRTHPDWNVCVDDTARVGNYPAGASPYGVMDMAGNVFEWVSDLWYQDRTPTYYAVSPYANPTGFDGGKRTEDSPLFVIRGGSYRPNWYYTRTFHRHHGHHGENVNGDAPLYRNDQVGFRCARPLNE